MACLREAHEGTGATTTDKCPLCAKWFGRDTGRFYSQVAHQMEDIRLLALPPAYRDEQDGGSCDTSTTGSVLDDTPREGLLNVRLHRWMQERPEGELRREGMEDQDDLEDQDALDDQDALENQDASEDQDVSEDQDALERAFWEEPAACPIAVMGIHWEIYQQYIRDRFPHAREELDIEDLARGNAECYVRLVRLDQERGEEEEEMEQRQCFPSPGVATTFKDSGLRSSAPHSLPPVSIHASDPFPAVVVSQPAIVPVNTALAPPPSVSSLSRSTICSVLSEPSKRRLLPQVPEHSQYGSGFKCRFCGLNQRPTWQGHRWRYGRSPPRYPPVLRLTLMCTENTSLPTSRHTRASAPAAPARGCSIDRRGPGSRMIRHAY
jgi:hypothetical protein